MTMLRKTIKRTSILWISMSAFFLMSATAFAGPSSVDETTMKDVKQEMKEAASAIKNYSATQRDEALKAAKLTLDKLDAEIERMENALDKKSEKMNHQARKKARSTLQTLRKQRNEVAEWYGSMKHSTEEAWQDIKTGFLKSYQILQHSFDKAADEYK